MMLTATALVSRGRALQGVEELLKDWRTDDELIDIARREKPLPVGVPPGSEQDGGMHPWDQRLLLS
jgi:hypothetical protein